MTDIEKLKREGRRESARIKLAAYDDDLVNDNDIPWDDDADATEVIKTLIVRRSRVHETRIRETERTTRRGYMLATALLGWASAIPIFAPLGREIPSWWISAALFVFAAGAMGYTHISAKTKQKQFSLSKRD